MAGWFTDAHPLWQGTLAGLFTWSVTALGAGIVFFLQRVNRRLLDAMLGFSGGVMLAASFWSLLAPAIAIAEEGPLPAWLPPTIGLLLGAGCLFAFDKSLPHLHLFLPIEEAEGPRTNWQRSVLLVTAITLHNIPEGLAVGVAFGGVAADVPGATFGAALALAIGIGLQNFPEGVAVALPLRGDGYSRRRSFFYGQLSGMVEPLAALLGAAAVLYVSAILSYALAFAAGAMIYVVVEELIPESHRAGNADLATLCLMLGFVVMMCLDVGLA